MADVFLHVGLPKTGTTSIQAALEKSAQTLSESGVLFPGGSHRAQRLAVYDLLGQRVQGDVGDVVPGAFRRLVAEIGSYGGRAAVVSEEELGLARPRHVDRVIRSLRGQRVFVVIGVRDFARTLVSAWQQSVMTGSTTTWQEFVDAVRNPGKGAVREGGSFWIRQDVFRVLDAWGSRVPAERIRVVTVPPSGSPSGLLLHRFAAAASLPQELQRPAAPPLNKSVGAAEVEVIRRLNHAVAGRLNKHQYRHVIEEGVRLRLDPSGTRRLALPRSELDWVQERSDALISELRRRGYRVYGDLQDLVPRQADTSDRRLDEVPETELLAAAEAALASLAVAHGALFRRYRQAFFERNGTLPGAGELLGSSARATRFRLEKAALAGADHNHLLAWAVRRYLDRGLSDITGATARRNRMRRM